MAKLEETKELQNEQINIENDLQAYKDQIRRTQKGLAELKVIYN